LASLTNRTSLKRLTSLKLLSAASKRAYSSIAGNKKSRSIANISYNALQEILMVLDLRISF
jgi:hypothetical protein